MVILHTCSKQCLHCCTLACHLNKKRLFWHSQRCCCSAGKTASIGTHKTFTLQSQVNGWLMSQDDFVFSLWPLPCPRCQPSWNLLRGSTETLVFHMLMFVHCNHPSTLEGCIALEPNNNIFFFKRHWRHSGDRCSTQAGWLHGLFVYRFVLLQFYVDSFTIWTCFYFKVSIANWELFWTLLPWQGSEMQSS